jgi:hypothetical protein
MVPLSEEEQRLLEQMEEALAAEDPKFASALRGAASRQRHKRITIAGIAGFVVGIAILMTGAVQRLPWLGVVGFLVMLGCAYLALTHWRKMSEPDLPDNVHPIGKTKGRTAASKPTGFMNRMEDRWRRRRDEY